MGTAVSDRGSRVSAVCWTSWRTRSKPGPGMWVADEAPLASCPACSVRLTCLTHRSRSWVS